MDPVNPDHYRSGEVEAIDSMRAMVKDWNGISYFQAHCVITASKYIWRCCMKGEFKENIDKAIWYLRMAIGDDPRKEREDASSKS